MTTDPGVLRLAPHSPESEEAVIGGILTDPDQFLFVSAYLKPADFHVNRLALVWEAMTRLFAGKAGIDILTVSEELRAMGKADQFEDKARGFLVNLINRTPTSTHVDTYARVVERLAVRRRLLTAADEVKTLAYDEQLSVEEITSQAVIRIHRVVDTDRGDLSWSEMLDRSVSETERRMEEPGQYLGIPSGFRDHDELLGGFEKSALYVYAARPGMGKTSLLLSIMLNAMKIGGRIGLLSQEMDWMQILQRFAALESGINLQNIRLGRFVDARGEYDPHMYARYVEAVGRLSNLKHAPYVSDARNVTPHKLLAKAARWQAEGGLDLLIVDYLQILSSDGMFRPGVDRVAEVGYFARELKSIARELHVPLITAAQLNRGLESRGDKRPILSDLRESGEIEQEADVVTFIYRDVVYNEDTQFPNQAELITAKHRNGPTGKVDLHFERSLTKFSDSRITKIDLNGL